MTDKATERRFATIETTQAGLAVQGAETQAAVKAHTAVVEGVRVAVAELNEALDDSRLFELLPEIATTSGRVVVAAGDTKAIAERTAAAAQLLVEDNAKRAPLVDKLAAGIDTVNRTATATGDQAKAALGRLDTLTGHVEDVTTGLGLVADALTDTKGAIGTERTARERWQAATGKRLDELAADLAAAKTAAEAAKSSAERTATAAEAQAADVEAIKGTVETILAAVTAIARGETKASVRTTGESPGAAGE